MAFTATATRQALLLGAVLGWCAQARGQAPPATPASAPAPHYVLEATLDPETHRIEGTLTVTFSVPHGRLEALWLHLYANGVRNAESVYQQGRSLPAAARGHIELKSLEVDGEDRLAAAETELLPGDFTRVRVALDRPRASSERVRLQARFVTHLPRLAERTGHADDFHLVSQWYPKLAFLDAHGSFQAAPFERMGEFRANHGSYALTVHAPAGYQVEAGGSRTGGVGGDPWRFRIQQAGDVAVAACRRCESREVQHGQVTIRQLFVPGSREAAARQLEVLKAGLDHFGRTLGPYPYPQLVAVTPARDAPLLGMEYPGFVVVPPGPSPVRSSPLLDGRHVAAHELAHQWFYALVGSDELRFPVLDEGLTEWATGDLLRHMQAADTLGLDTFEVMRLGTQVGRPPAPPAGMPAYTFDAFSYGRAVYARAALALESVRRSHGDPRFRRALARYVAAHRFQQATPEDLAEAFDGAYAAGFFERVVGPLLLDGAGCDVHLDSVRGRAVEGGHETRVHAHRSGRVQLPTWVRLADATGGTLARVPWPQGRSTLQLVVHTAQPVARVELDPDGALLVDESRLDQRWQRGGTFAGPHWTSLLFAAAQVWLGLWGP